MGLLARHSKSSACGVNWVSHCLLLVLLSMAAAELSQGAPKSENITWHDAEITQEQRETAVRQKGCVVWFTGLSGSGKSCISRRVEQKLLSLGKHTYAIDGDNVRHGLNSDLG